MPLTNRVTPEGQIVTSPARGTFMGNRGGCFHTDDKKLTRRRWHSSAWIICRLDFKDRHREVMSPRKYTELFFLDEATALAAGHRPCFECRRQEATSFASHWATVMPAQEHMTVTLTGSRHSRRMKAADMDRVLHQQRLDKNFRITLESSIRDLPTGAFIKWRSKSYLVHENSLFLWSETGYSFASVTPDASAAEVLTPPATIAVLSSGYKPGFHHSINDSRSDHMTTHDGSP